MARQASANEGGVPWCVQPELTEGCTMSKGSGPGGLCHFCGLAAIRRGPGDFNFMAPALAAKIADGLVGWQEKPRIEFAMRGEPLANPDHLEIFRIFRERLPRANMMVTTNGDTLRSSPGRLNTRMKKRVPELFAAGLDYILLDTYYPKERRDALRAEAFDLAASAGDIEVVDFYDDWVPAGKSPYANHGRKIQRTIVLMDDLAARDGEHSSRQIKTHAGSNPMGVGKDLFGAAAGFPMARSCGRPFREMTIAWNGDFTLCCDDWKKEYIIGNVADRSLPDLWSDPALEAARARLYHRDRGWGPCAKCDAPGAPRFGLLPVYEPATEEQIRLTESNFKARPAAWEGPLTKIGEGE